MTGNDTNHTYALMTIVYSDYNYVIMMVINVLY